MSIAPAERRCLLWPGPAGTQWEDRASRFLGATNLCSSWVGFDCWSPWVLREKEASRGDRAEEAGALGCKLGGFCVPFRALPGWFQAMGKKEHKHKREEESQASFLR